ncbi:MAG: DUF4440 domain-containing protein [Gemmatimonadetes bacterium]|nr:DUF4440 domain-containing protein [Gemmatimonadota bacterium]
MKMLSLLLAVPVAAGSACAPRVDLTAERTALRRADSAYSAAAQSKDIDALVAWYTADAVMYPPNEPTVSGIDGVRQYGTNMLNTPGLTVGFTPLDVQVSATGGMGYTINTARVTMTDPKGAPVSEELRDFHVWRKEPDGSWKVAVDIWNSPTPPAPPPAMPTGRR